MTWIIGAACFIAGWLAHRYFAEIVATVALALLWLLGPFVRRP